jgi:tetratricopeptide (TPR) repeat protein
LILARRSAPCLRALAFAFALALSACKNDSSPAPAPTPAASTIASAEDARAPDAHSDSSAREALERGLLAQADGDTLTALRQMAVAIEHADGARNDSLARSARAARARVQCNAGKKEACSASADDAEARLAALETTTGALAALESERLQAVAAQRDAETWRALLGRGRVLESMSKRQDALDAYRAAEDIIEDALITAPFRNTRTLVTPESRESTQRAAALLLAMGRGDEALGVVRRARARTIRSSARAERVAMLTGPDREKWHGAVTAYRVLRDQLDAEAPGDAKKARPALEALITTRKARYAKLRAALDEALAVASSPRGDVALPALREDELVLAYFELGGDIGVAGFAIENGKVRAFRANAGVGPGASDADAGSEVDGGARDALLVPVSAELTRAKRVRVLAEGALASVDIHALTWNGTPLVAHLPVVYGLDLPPAKELHSGGAALVVSDPTSNLPTAREDAKRALALLGKHYDPRALTGREATATRVRESLSGAGFFEYAGRGVFLGREGGESALPLSDGAFAVGDVLTLPGAPELVVLSGCEAARAPGATGVHEEGATALATAFIVAGASEAIAPVRVVDDRTTSSVARALHAAFDASGSRDLANALREAQVRSFRDGRTGWESFRAFAR